jgi:hypothetical protein
MDTDALTNASFRPTLVVQKMAVPEKKHNYAGERIQS